MFSCEAALPLISGAHFCLDVCICKLYELRVCNRASKVVAVVGAGHLAGMRERWNADIDFEEISSMPAAPQKGSSWPWRRIALLGISGVALTAVITTRRRR